MLPQIGVAQVTVPMYVLDTAVHRNSSLLTQNPVAARPCGFDPLLRHHQLIGGYFLVAVEKDSNQILNS
jgi:hypothetical protein